MWLKRIGIILVIAFLVFGAGFGYIYWKQGQIEANVLSIPQGERRIALFRELTPNHRNLTRIRKLLEVLPDPEAADENGYTALMLAVGMRDMNADIIKLFVEAGANVNAQDKRGITPLIYLQANDPDVLEVLLDAGAEVNKPDQAGATPLMSVASIWRVNPAMVRMLIKAGAKVTAKTKQGNTVLDYALVGGESLPPPLAQENEPVTLPQVLKELEKGGLNLNAKNKDGKTVLIIFSEETNNKAAIAALIQAGVDVNIKDKKGQTAADYAHQNKALWPSFKAVNEETDMTTLTIENHTYIPVEGDQITASNYADKTNWLALPATNYPADIFYVYPTVWIARKGQYPIAPIDFEPMRKGAAKAFATQATAFETAGNLYAPYYRQLDAGFTLTKSDTDKDQLLRGVPKVDIVASFEYYLKHYNQGKPFILAGHSQGATILKEIVFDYLKKNPEAAKNMVAAYILGYSVTKQELANNAHVKFAEGADDTGVIISYNTEAPVIGGNNLTWLPNSVAINPISWTRGEKEAPAQDNLGSSIERGGELEKTMNLANAQVNLKRGTVICSTVDPKLYSIGGEFAQYFPKGVYHGYDVGFYYYNLRENAENRVKHFLKGKE